MTIIYLLEVHGSYNDDAPLSTEQISQLELCLKALPDVTELYLFSQAEGGHDPFLKDAHPPVLVIQALFKDKESLHLALSSSEFKKLHEQLLSLPVRDLRLLQEALLLESFLSSATETELANLSYLVNYQRPAENEIDFLQYYRAHHPPLLLHFPTIRRVELGTPIDWIAAEGIERADRMLYCEVSFDDIELLNRALNSDVRKDLRKDYDCFPPFSGEVTHFPMHRKALL